MTVRQNVVCCTLIKVIAFYQQSCFISSYCGFCFVFDAVVVFCVFSAFCCMAWRHCIILLFFLFLNLFFIDLCFRHQSFQFQTATILLITPLRPRKHCSEYTYIHGRCLFSVSVLDLCSWCMTGVYGSWGKWCLFFMGKWCLFLVDEWYLFVTDEWCLFVVDEWCLFLVDEWCLFVTDEWYLFVTDEWCLFVTDEWCLFLVKGRCPVLCATGVSLQWPKGVVCSSTPAWDVSIIILGLFPLWRNCDDVRCDVRTSIPAGDANPDSPCGTGRPLRGLRRHHAVLWHWLYHRPATRRSGWMVLTFFTRA